MDRRLPSEPGATGGHFSVGYVVSHGDGRKAFLKALDFAPAMRQPDPAQVLQAMTAGFTHERDVLLTCEEARMSRVVRALEHGTIFPLDAQVSVPFLVFEFADGGTSRPRVEAALKTFDVAWLLRSLHHVATGLQQLHARSIVHQDVKPSNVLVFADGSSKIADLGRSSWKGRETPHDPLACAGDRSYAPPELLYGHVSEDWGVRRQACDLYLFGSLFFFFFTQVGATALMLSHLPQPLHPTAWNGDYDSVLPHIRDAFEHSVTEFSRSTPPDASAELETMVRQLCDPDPKRRGHPRSHASLGSSFSLERYVSNLDILAKRFEYRSK